MHKNILMQLSLCILFITLSLSSVSAVTDVKDNNTIDGSMFHMSFYTPDFINITQTTAKISLIDGLITYNHNIECKSDFEDGTAGCMTCVQGECAVSDHSFNGNYAYYLHKIITSQAEFKYTNDDNDVLECTLWASTTDTSAIDAATLGYYETDIGDQSIMPIRQHDAGTVTYYVYDGSFSAFVDSNIVSVGSLDYKKRETWNFIRFMSNETYFIFGNNWTQYYTNQDTRAYNYMTSFMLRENNADNFTFDDVICYDPSSINESANTMITNPLYFNKTFNQISFNATTNGTYTMNYSCNNGTTWYSQSVEYANYSCEQETNYLTLKLILGADNTTSVSALDVTTSVENILPNASNTSITPLPALEGDTLYGHCLYNDSDNDPAIGNFTRWYVNNTVIVTANNTYTLLPGNVTGLANITFECWFNDTHDVGNKFNSSVVTIGDSTAPTFKGNRTSVATVSVYGSLTLYVNVTDALSNIDVVKAEVQDPNQQKSNLTMTLSSGSVTDGEWEVVYTTSSLQGTYNVTFYATDSSGNGPSNTDSYLSFTATTSGGGTTTTTTGGGGGGGGDIPTIKPKCKNIELAPPLLEFEIKPTGVFGGKTENVLRTVLYNNEDFTFTPTIKIADTNLISLRGNVVTVKPGESLELIYILDEENATDKTLNGSLSTNSIIQSTECKDITLPIIISTIGLVTANQTVVTSTEFGKTLFDPITQVNLGFVPSFTLRFVHIIVFMAFVTLLLFIFIEPLRGLRFSLKLILFMVILIVFSLIGRIIADLLIKSVK